jgi:small conductance mechanosensitive channel
MPAGPRVISPVIDLAGNPPFGSAMRGSLLSILILVLAALFSCPRAAVAQSALAIHQPATPPATAVTPAKATAGAIIPGSPLAALTGAASGNAAPSDQDNASPFGTGSFGMSIVDSVGDEAARTLDDLLKAVRQSTELTPVWEWAQSFHDVPTRRAHAADIIMAVMVTIVPALLVEAVIRFALTRPRAALVNRAGRAREAPEGAGSDPEETIDDSENDKGSDESGLADAEAGETEARPNRRDTVMAWLRRFGFGLLHLVLAVLPVIGFGLTIAVTLGLGIVTARQAQLSVVGIANAYLVCRLSLEFVRFLLAPQASPVRLIKMSDGRAVRLTAWTGLLVISGAVGFIIVSVSEILGLSPSGARAITALFGLLLHIELAIAVWQSRFVVAGWIRGRRKTTYAASFRGGLASIWHYLALFYILALWIALAGGVHHAFGFLLRVIVVFIAALAFGVRAWKGSTHLLDRLFPDPDSGAARHPKFAARARAYNPLVRVLIRVVIAVLVLVAILLGWGIDVLPWLLNDPFSRALIIALISIIITIAAALFLWEVCNAYILGRIERLSSTGRTRQASRLRTLLPMLRATIGVVIGLTAGLICLSKIGVNAAPLLAGAGVVGIAVGFGSQKLVQDIITGLFLLLEDAMQVGDVVTLAGMSGTVERLSIRTIRLRGGDGSINIIPFSAVTTVTNMTRDFGYAEISITVGYKENIDHVSAVLADIAREMRAEPAWGAMIRDDLQLFGLDQFGSIGLVLLGQIRTGPGQHWSVRREFYGRVQKRFAEEGIEIPYTHQSFAIDLVPPQAPVVSGQPSEAPKPPPAAED